MPFPRLDDEDTPQSVVVPPTPYPTPDLNAAPATANEEPTNHGRSDSLPLMSASPAPYVQKQPNVPRGTLPGMPPSMTPDDLAPYLGQQKQAMSKFGPQQQVELENSLVNQRNGLGYKLADAGKGFADALMQGVAGAGNPGWQKQFEDQNMMQGQEQMGVLQKAHEGQLQDTEAGMKLDNMNPSSPISKSFQQAASPIFAQMGISADKVAKMPASQIETIASLGLKSEDIRMQGELKKLMQQFENQYRTADLSLKQQGLQQGALEKAGKMGFIDRNFTQPEVYNQLMKTGMGGSGGSEPFNHDAIPSGTVYKAPDGTMRKKQ